MNICRRCALLLGEEATVPAHGIQDTLRYDVCRYCGPAWFDAVGFQVHMIESAGWFGEERYKELYEMLAATGRDLIVSLEGILIDEPGEVYIFSFPFPVSELMSLLHQFGVDIKE